MAVPEVCVVYLTVVRSGVREVLLGRKRTGLGKGKVVAPGGKLEVGETPEQAAIRELREEVGIKVGEGDLVLVGELLYLFPHKPEWTQKSWVFAAEADFDSPQPSRKLDAAWVAVNEIPFSSMWDDAQYWLTEVLEGAKVHATFTFGEDLATVESSDHPAFLGRDTRS